MPKPTLISLFHFHTQRLRDLSPEKRCGHKNSLPMGVLPLPYRAVIIEVAKFKQAADKSVELRLPKCLFPPFFYASVDISAGSRGKDNA